MNSLSLFERHLRNDLDRTIHCHVTCHMQNSTQLMLYYSNPCMQDLRHLIVMKFLVWNLLGARGGKGGGVRFVIWLTIHDVSIFNKLKYSEEHLPKKNLDYS